MVILNLKAINLLRKLEQKTLETFKKNHMRIKMIIIKKKIRIIIKEKNLVKEKDQGQEMNKSILLKDVTEIQILLIGKKKE